MDKVLLRPIFKQRYLEEYKISSFNTGGIVQNIQDIPKFKTGGMSSRDKALYAATFAGPLLTGTRAPGESMLGSTLRSVGEGMSKVPSTMIALEELEGKKRKGSKSIRAATVEEKTGLGYNKNDRLIVNVDEYGEVTGIADKPTAGERDKRAERETAIHTADSIIHKTGKINTGPIAGIFQKIGIATGLNPEVAEYNVQLEEFKKSAIKAMRGAQVGPLEEASFDALLPDITDPENVIIAKVKVMKEKLQQIEARLGPDGVVEDPGNVESYIQVFEELGIDPSTIGSFDSSIPTYSLKEEELIEIGP